MENINEIEAKSNISEMESLNNLPLIKCEETNKMTNNIASVKQQRIQKLLNSIDLFTDDLSNTIEKPLTEEEQKRIEEILNEKSYDKTDSYTIISPHQLHINPIKLERINTINQLLAEMKAEGHAYIKNIPSSKCKSKNTKTLDELKTEMNKIDEALVTSRKKREAEQAIEDSENKTSS